MQMQGHKARAEPIRELHEKWYYHRSTIAPHHSLDVDAAVSRLGEVPVLVAAAMHYGDGHR